MVRYRKEVYCSLGKGKEILTATESRGCAMIGCDEVRGELSQKGWCQGAKFNMSLAREAMHGSLVFIQADLEHCAMMILTEE